MSTQPHNIILTLEIPTAESEIAIALLDELACQGVWEQPASRPGKVILQAYFPADQESLESAVHTIREACAPYPRIFAGIREIRLEPEADWSEQWKQFFEPFELVPQVIVKPSWEHFPPQAGQKIIELDPGMAFGTGLHETTRLCARAIATILETATNTPPSLLEIGTGSGILCILARLLGATQIIAVENDPVALAVARENFSKNGCPDIPLFLSLDELEGTFDLIVANILLNPLKELAPAIISRLAPKSWCVLSGVTAQQEQELIDVYAPHATTCQTSRMGEWSCLVLRRDR